MAATLSDFIRWARDRVIERPAVAHYHLRCVECGLKFSDFDLSGDQEEIRLEPAYDDDDDDLIGADWADPPEPEGAEEA